MARPWLVLLLLPLPLIQGAAQEPQPPFSGVELATVSASDATASDHFGFAVAAFADTAVIGALHDDNSGGVDAGALYVFQQNGSEWTQQAKLMVDGGAPGDHLGSSVAIDADTIVVGATGVDDFGNGSGAAYVFVRSGTSAWTQQAALYASDAAPGDGFGSAVSIHGNTIAVTAPSKDINSQPPGFDRGAAYVFARVGTSWSQQAKLLASDGANHDRFGECVVIRGDTVVVGANNADPAGVINAGAVYVYDRSGLQWAEVQKLTAPDLSSMSSFGKSVSLSNETLLVGANLDDSVGPSNAGSAYVFVRQTSWTFEAKLTAPVPVESDAFGHRSALHGDVAIIGASGADDAGVAYVYSRREGAWQIEAALRAAEGEADDSNSGVHVDFTGDMVLVGIPADDNFAGVDAGTVAVFQLVPIATWDDLGGGTSGFHGIPSLAGDGFLWPGSTMGLALTSAAPLAIAVLFVAGTSTPTAFLGGTLHAFPYNDLLVLFTNTAGEFVGTATFPAGIAPGTEIYFQYGIVDPAVPVYGASLSNGLRATVR